MNVKPIREANYIIGEGDAGIYETVDFMWNYALRDADEALVKRAVNQLKGKNNFSTIKNIYDFVWRNVKYKKDPADREMITSPIHYLNGNRKTGDCDCMTTLLVCLLESAGFDCSIVVIAWREISYTHVFAEVWHNNKWFLLDPTLKENGFGKQDKDIIRYKRITKKDMAKLQVLADSGTEQKPIRRINSNRCGRRQCCGNHDDNNRNANNININFGTSVENSHNNSNEGGRSIDLNQLPKMENIYENYRPQNREQKPIIEPQENILKQNKNINYDAKNKIIAPEYRVKNNSVGAMNKRVVVNNKRPKYVPNVVRNYYPEFP